MKTGKLVRNGIPKKIMSMGGNPETRTLAFEEYREALKRKISEEATEVKEAQNQTEIMNELCDLLEVMMALANAYEVKWEWVETTRTYKKKDLGGFDDRVLLITEEDD